MELNYKNHQEYLGILSCQNEISAAVKTSQIVLCFGETGCGKTTQLPLIIKNLNINQKLICIVKDNIISTKNSAEYVALQNNIKIGHDIGYVATGSNYKFSNKTKVIYITYERILNEYIYDRQLSKYSTIILDDLHIQSLSMKLLCEILQKLCQIRIDLRLIITSIPYNIDRIQQYFTHSVSIYIPESIFPIDIFHAKMKELKVAPENNSYIQGALNVIKKIHDKQDIGNILVYLPTMNDVNMLYALLQQSINDLQKPNRKLYIYKYFPSITNKEINEIYQSLPVEYTTITPTSTTINSSNDTTSSTSKTNVNATSTPTTTATTTNSSGNNQYRVLMRKCILTAEVSDCEIHVPYIRYSIDSGYALRTIFSNGSSKSSTSGGNICMEQEVIAPITQCTAMVRAGRAGSVSAGQCYRLYSIPTAEGLEHGVGNSSGSSNTNNSDSSSSGSSSNNSLHSKNEYSSMLLYLKALHLPDVRNIQCIQYSEAKQTTDDALLELYQLGALHSDGSLTEVGRKMALFPMLTPVLARMVVAATDSKCSCTGEIATICSILSTNASIWQKPSTTTSATIDTNHYAHCKQQFYHEYGDYHSYLLVYNACRQQTQPEQWCIANCINYRVLYKALRIRTQIEAALSELQQAHHNVASTASSTTSPLSLIDDRIATAITTALYYHSASYNASTRSYDVSALNYSSTTSSSSSNSGAQLQTFELYSESILSSTRIEDAPIVFHSFHRDSGNPHTSIIFMQHICKADLHCLIELQTAYAPPVLSLLLQYPSTVLVQNGSAISTSGDRVSATTTPTTDTVTAAAVVSAVANGVSGSDNCIPQREAEEEDQQWERSAYTTAATVAAAATLPTIQPTPVQIPTTNNNNGNCNTDSCTINISETCTYSVLHKNSSIEANLRGEGVWYPGTILTDYGNGVHYNVALTLEDGSIMQCKMKRKFIRPIDPVVNNNILCSDNAVTILENNNVEVLQGGVNKESIAATSSGNSSNMSSSGYFNPIQEGDRVEGNYQGSGQWYPAVVDRVRGDGSVDLDYDDGEREVRISAENVRRSPPSGHPSMSVVEPDIPFQEGDEVEGNYQGAGQWYAAVVDRIRVDGTYDLDYENGDREARIPEHCVRWPKKVYLTESMQLQNELLSVLDTHDTHALYQEDDQVEGNYKGLGVWILGTIDRIREDGTYDIMYEDGRHEARIHPEERIRPVQMKNASETTASLAPIVEEEEKEEEKPIQEGDRVEGNYQGSGQWYPAVVDRVRGDGSVDLDYDDGEREVRISAENVRRPVPMGTHAITSIINPTTTTTTTNPPPHITTSTNPLATTTTTDNSSEITASPSVKFTVGMKVQVSYHNTNRWYRGTIAAQNANHTYEIQYDDGDQESQVRQECIIEYHPPPASCQNFQLGDKVSVLYASTTRRFPAQITKNHQNSYFDIRYTDGELEYNVPVDKMIPLIPSQPKMKKSKRKKVSLEDDQMGTTGSTVETAPLIQNKDDINDNSTVNSLPSTINTTSTTDRNSTSTVQPDTLATPIQEGDRVEGNYQGSGQWYPAVVDRVRGDGSVDLDYDDGEREVRIAAENVRRPASSLNSTRSNSNTAINSYTATTNAALAAATAKDTGFRQNGLAQTTHGEVPGSGSTRKDLVVEAEEYSTTPVRTSANYSTLSPMPRPAQPSSSFHSPIKAGRLYTQHSFANNPTDTIPTVNTTKSVSFSIPPTIKPSTKVDVFDTEANYHNKGIWLPVVAITDRFDGMYDVYYEDGDFEEAILPNRIYPDPTKVLNSINNSTGSNNSSSLHTTTLKWFVGEEVQVNYRNKHFWLPAKVTKVHVDSSADVVYEDGEIEAAVPCLQLRARAEQESTDTSSNPQPSPPRGHRAERPLSSSATSAPPHHHRHHRHKHHHDRDHSDSPQKNKAHVSYASDTISETD